MMERQRINYTKAEEREALVVIQTRNGYTVRAGKEPKTPAGKAGGLYIEYWMEGGAAR